MPNRRATAQRPHTQYLAKSPGEGKMVAHANAPVTKVARESEITKRTLFATLRRPQATQSVMMPLRPTFMNTMLAARMPEPGERALVRAQPSGIQGRRVRAAASSAAQSKKAEENPVAPTTRPKTKAPEPVPASKATFQSVLPSPYSAFETRSMIRSRVAFWRIPKPAPKSSAPPSKPKPSTERAAIPSAAETRPGARRRRGFLRSPKRPAHQREKVLVSPRRSSAVAAEKSPAPGAASGRKVMTTPAATVQEAKSSKIRRSGPLFMPERNPPPPLSPRPSAAFIPRAAKKPSRGVDAPARKTGA